VKVDVVRLEVPALPEYLALARMVVAGTARIDPLLDDERVDDLRLIVSEACTNAIEAMRDRASSNDADGPDADGTDRDRAVAMRVECRLGASRVEVVVEDRGNGFDPEALDALPSVTDPSRLTVERGLGLPLIRTLSDEYDITSGSTGTRVWAALYAAAAAPPPDAL